MKKITRLMLLAGVLSLFGVSESKAQEIVVRERMHAPVVAVRPARPARGYVWIGEEWTPSGRTYVYKGGYWARPPFPRAKWVAGHWRRSPRGWVWRPGHWRR
jgi:hypothetical protein